MEERLRQAEEQRFTALQHTLVTLRSYAEPSLSPDEMSGFETVEKTLLRRYMPLDDNRIVAFHFKAKTGSHIVPYSKDEFISRLKLNKPVEIFNSGYSRKLPLYIIASYAKNGVKISATSWADKAPIFKTWQQLYTMFSREGLAQIHYYPTI